MTRERMKYDREFKREAVRLALEGGHTVEQVADDLGVNVYTLRAWIRAFKKQGQDAFRGSGERTSEEKDLFAMRRELELVKQERDIPKKRWPCFPGTGASVRVHRRECGLL